MNKSTLYELHTYKTLRDILTYIVQEKLWLTYNRSDFLARKTRLSNVAVTSFMY